MDLLNSVNLHSLLLNIEYKAMLVAFWLHHKMHAMITACLHTLLKFLYRKSKTDGKLSMLAVSGMPRRPASALENDSIMDVLLEVSKKI